MRVKGGGRRGSAKERYCSRRDLGPEGATYRLRLPAFNVLFFPRTALADQL